MLLFSTDIDGTIFDGPESARRFSEFWDLLRQKGDAPLLVYNTGRSLTDTRQLVTDTGLPEPEYIIGGVGTEILDLTRDVRVEEWEATLSGSWDFATIERIVRETAPGIEFQPDACQNRFKCSWYWEGRSEGDIRSLETVLANEGMEAQVVYSSNRDLDVLPRRSNKGNAVRWLADWLGLTHEAIAIAGDSGNDASMFQLEKVFRILVSNAHASLKEGLGAIPVHRAQRPCVDGVIEGIEIWMKSRREVSTGWSRTHNLNDLYLVHISVHGLIRGENLELGRDADTGGQCRYVLELVKALAEHKSVSQVDLFTRMVSDPKVDSDYAKPVEPLGHGAFIRRIQAGPRRYFRKEVLWRYLDAFIDQCLAMFRENGRLPDILHAHYADAGYIGSRLASLLGCPFVFTGHSLGRSKLERLLKNGAGQEQIEQRYNLSTRIEAEELSLDSASIVITSTNQEVEEQYSHYDQYVPERKRVIPPGVDVSRFAPPDRAEIPDAVVKKIERYLDDPGRPVVLAIARADEKKNLASLVQAFGQSETLRDRANLVLVAGNRDTIGGLNPGARKVWMDLLRLIDDFDLHGRVSIPKHHEPNEIPAFYRYAAARKGLFVNPALTEPFGLTLIEAAASGLPVLATNDGGPQDILANCGNGELIDPLDIPGITHKLERALSDSRQWEAWARNGLKGVYRHYTWKGHVDRYLDETAHLLEDITQPQLITDKTRTSLPLKDRIVFTGLENHLLDGDAEVISRVREMIDDNQPRFGFGIVTGRSLSMARDLVDQFGLPEPDVFITQLGAEIHYGKRQIPDLAWEQHLAHRWDPSAIKDVLAGIPGLKLQSGEGRQHRFKISYEFEEEATPRRRKEIQKRLREKGLGGKVLLSQARWLDVIPLRSGKGHAIRYTTMRWGIPADHVLFYARRGSDYEALSGQFLAVLGSDHAPELRPSTSLPRVYLSKKPNFAGLWEGIRAYGFDAAIRVPESAAGHYPEDVGEQESVIAPDMVAHTGAE